MCLQLTFQPAAWIPPRGKIYIYIFDPPTAMVADLLCVFHCVTQEQTQALAGDGGGVTSYTHFLVRKRYVGVTCLVSRLATELLLSVDSYQGSSFGVHGNNEAWRESLICFFIMPPVPSPERKTQAPKPRQHIHTSLRTHSR